MLTNTNKSKKQTKVKENVLYYVYIIKKEKDNVIIQRNVGRKKKRSC